jgi:hypothetical protein
MKATSKDFALHCLPAVGSFSGAAAQNELSFDGFELVDKTGNIHKPVLVACQDVRFY